MPDNLGTVDYRAYWGSSYLLARGENFADDDTLLQLQLEKTNGHEDFPIKTWNPPWVLVWLIPYSLIPFKQATSLWLLTNIGALLFSIFASWQLVIEKEETKRWLWLGLATAILFPSTIVSHLFGQVNLIVLAGLVGALYFDMKKKETAVGGILALTTFKPHLVYLVLPMLLLRMVEKRAWKQLAAFTTMIVVPMSIAFVLRPTILADYFQGTADGNLMQWETATLVTYLSLQSGLGWLRWSGIVLLPLFLLWSWQKRKSWQLTHITQVGVLLSIITMPFGWSYDFVLLLWPMMQVVVWLVELPLTRWEKVAGWGAFVLIYGLYYWQRVIATNEIVFFWVPLPITAVYLYYLWRARTLTPTQLEYN